jgi:acetoin utilization deacetylase AcuC-like enzyme
MIKREHIKQAIDAIGSRRPDIGRALDELLGTGRITVQAEGQPASDGSDFFFLFDRDPVRVPKFLFIHEGTAPIERGLLIKYGGLLRKQELRGPGRPRDLLQAAREVRSAGLRLLVRYEIDLAIARARHAARGKSGDRGAPAEEIIARLSAIGADTPQPRVPLSGRDERVVFRGLLDDCREALFTRFPFGLETLMQAADINLEFFDVRFLLNCLVSGWEQRLFVCALNGHIAGMLFLGLKTGLFYRGLEIKYVATLRGRHSEEDLAPPKGVGRFLMAGTWLLWKLGYGRAHEIVLDSEVEARQFYERMGFRPKGPHRYVLSRPGPDLARTILLMAEASPDLPPKGTVAIGDLITQNIRTLRRIPKTDRDKALHRQVEAMTQTALASRAHPAIAAAATRALLRVHRSLSQIEHLMAEAAQNPSVCRWFAPDGAALAVGVVCDTRFTRHLEGIFHMESSKRCEAIQAVIQDPSLADRILQVEPRPATAEELAWVHSPAYIARVAATAGQPLTSMDIDTQTTAESFDTARLAVGAVFSLIDAIQAGRVQCGFAAVRPPGHHAEPERGMGFCIFNNVALGARYLQQRYGVKRVMLVDIDAHHGNGTQAAFYDTDAVLAVSIHQFPGFPGTGKLGEVGTGRGEGYTVNVPLRKGHGDRDFLLILQFLVRPLARAYQPEIILVPCGFDLWLHDRLAEMRVTAEGYGLMAALLAEVAEEVCGGRILFVLEGGYSVEGIRECGMRVMESLCRPSPATQESLHRITAEDPEKLTALRKAIQIHRKYWPILK